MFKSAITIMFGLLLMVSLIMLVSSSVNLNVFSNAMAVMLNPHLDSIILMFPSNEPYEAKSNYYQLPQKQQQQQQEEYQKDTNTYDNMLIQIIILTIGIMMMIIIVFIQENQIMTH
jgi:Ca2+/Na+ antiporter